MSAVGDLDRALAQVGEGVAAALTALTVAQDAWDEREQALYVLEGTNDPDALDVLAGHQPISDDMIRAYQIISRARELVESYRTGLEVQQAIDITPPSAAHPSTAGRIPTDAARDQQWADQVRKRIPSRGDSGQTTGFGYDKDGIEHHISSGHDPALSEQARLTLHNSKDFPTDPRGAPTVVLHVEVKYAQMMRQAGQTYGVVVVNNEVCKGCRKAVPELLPEGSTLVVWQPGSSQPLTFKGRARP